MPQENFNDLAAFVTVAREQSFTRAAVKLGVSQSALSQTVRSLEERLGLRLLTRTTRRVSPTAAGERLLQTAGPRFDEIQSELSALSDMRDKPAGTVRITTGEHAAISVLAPALEKIISNYPDINVEITVDYGLTDIVAERYDAGVRLGEQLAKDMIAVKIGPEMRMAVVGAPSYFQQNDYFGFGIQAFDGATDVLIADNVIKARRWDEIRIASAGQSQFTVTFARSDVQRFGMLVNGRRVTYTVNSTDSSPGARPTVTFTLTTALAGGETVTMFAWRSLENINVNFKTSGVKVINNVCNGTGDGNIVVASGYTTATDADYPHNVQITGNTCRNAAAGGIGVSKSRGGVIIGNTVIDAGHGLADGATGAQVSSLFMSGIYIPKELGWVISGNRVVRESGYTYYGIAFSLAGDTSYSDFRSFQTRHKVGVNFIENVRERNYYAFADSSDILRQVDIDIEDVTWVPYPETLQSLVNASGWVTRPASTTYWTTAAIGGWTRNTANALGHPVCIETSDNSYVDCTATAFPIFANSFLRVSFTARASSAGQSGYVSLGISHTSDANSGPLATVNVTDTATKRYQITLAVDTIDGFLLRVGGAPTSGKIYVTDIRLEYAPADVG